MPDVSLEKLQKSYPEFIFKPGQKFSFRPPKTILYKLSEPNFDMLILHELGHAALGHQTFKTDIERLKMERAAWEQAKILGQQFGIQFDDDFIEGELDTYRDWLHKKARCRECGLTRFQSRDGKYHCPHCDNLK